MGCVINQFKLKRINVNPNNEWPYEPNPNTATKINEWRISRSRDEDGIIGLS